ncbi:MAG: DedA family protein [Muribaculaceae bacterium]|jgi:membrane protein DedA with SNARE-associated domain|nr:DedA family protein [Muribaculaceae bacterium]
MIDSFILLSITDYLNAAWFFDWFVNNASYLFVFVFMVIESSFIPFPSEVVVPPAAYLAMQKGDMNIFLVVLAATAGALVGALVNYVLSLLIGRPIVYAFANSRFGHACLINQEKVEKAEKYFDNHGAASTFFGRLIPAVRQLISIPAGIAKMNIWVFMLFTSLGALIWNCILAGLGWWLSRHVSLDELYVSVEKYNSYLTLGGIVILVLCVLYILYNAFKKNNATKTK